MRLDAQDPALDREREVAAGIGKAGITEIAFPWRVRDPSASGTACIRIGPPGRNTQGIEFLGKGEIELAQIQWRAGTRIGSAGAGHPEKIGEREKAGKGKKLCRHDLHPGFIMALQWSIILAQSDACANKSGPAN
jgi:hypothetical protein